MHMEGSFGFKYVASQNWCELFPNHADHDLTSKICFISVHTMSSVPCSLLLSGWWAKLPCLSDFSVALSDSLYSLHTLCSSLNKGWLLK